MPDMSTFALDDPMLWKQVPEFARPMHEATLAVGCRIAYFALGDPDLESTPIAAVFEMPPGFVLRRHSHPCERFEVVIQGSMDLGERVAAVGSVMVSPPNEMYGPHTAGAEGCTTVEIFSSRSGSGRATYDTPDGPQHVNYRGD
jgi:hypothetical protein